MSHALLAKTPSTLWVVQATGGHHCLLSEQRDPGGALSSARITASFPLCTSLSPIVIGQEFHSSNEEHSKIQLNMHNVE